MRQLLGKDQAKAIERGTELQVAAGESALVETKEAAGRAQGFLDPLAGVGQQGIDQASFLTDPQAQFDFLQSNPLFQNALNLADRDTAAAAAAGGRLGAGDTALDFAGNFLQQATPLIDRQSAGIRDLLNIASGTGRAQANVELGLGSDVSNLLTDIGSVESAGGVGAAQAKGAAANNLLNIGLTLAGLV